MEASNKSGEAAAPGESTTERLVRQGDEGAGIMGGQSTRAPLEDSPEVIAEREAENTGLPELYEPRKEWKGLALPDVPREITYQECFAMREQKKWAALESTDDGQPTAKQTLWFRQDGWHPCKIDGRSVEVKFVGAGYGRAAGLVRPDDPDMGKCVVKVLCARSAQNQIEYETIQRARAAAGDSLLAEVLPRVRQVLLDGHSALLMTYAPEMREKVQGMVESFDKEL